MSSEPISLWPTGEQLYEELAREARARNISATRLAGKIWPYGPSWKLEQLRIAVRPTPATVDKIRAVIAGKPVDQDFEGKVEDTRLTITRAERAARGMPPSRREVRETALLRRHAETRSAVERRRRVSRMALEQKRPGETLHAAVARLEQEGWA